MVNSQVVAETINAFKLDTQKEIIPNAVPVVEVGIKSVKNGFSESQTRATTAALAWGTSSSQYDTYITSIVMSYVKDATCDVATGELYAYVTIGGLVRKIGSFAILTTTAQSDTIQIIFDHPLKIDRSAPIGMTGTFTAGAMSRSLTVTGYYDEIS